jgi:hypothetical protein
MMFKIRKGTKCHVYKKGSGGEWKPFTTTKELVFDTHGVTDNGGRWVFDNGDGWVLKVATCFVVGREEKSNEWVPLKRGKASTSRGRGASRRKGRR